MYKVYHISILFIDIGGVLISLLTSKAVKLFKLDHEEMEERHCINFETYELGKMTLNVEGYKEEGTITTPFDIRVQNDLDRFYLVQDVVDRVANLGTKGDYLKQMMKDKLIQNKHFINIHDEDMPEIVNWKWKID